MTLRCLGLVALFAVGCGGPSAKQAGDECVASSECGPGLVCDFGANPPVCASNLSIDARELDAPIDAAEIDAAEIDAPVIDARVIDAAVIDAAVDAAIDAVEIDAPTDAPIDAPP